MKHNQFIISGYVNGQKFRPSNWSERLCEAGATFDPLKRVMRYSEYLYPRQCEEHGCSVYVDFDALDAGLVDYINWFIESNSLKTVALPRAKPVNRMPTSNVAEVVLLDQPSPPARVKQFSYKSARTAA